jgi:hypothetical protein
MALMPREAGFDRILPRPAVSGLADHVRQGRKNEVAIGNPTRASLAAARQPAAPGPPAFLEPLMLGGCRTCRLPLRPLGSNAQ